MSLWLKGLAVSFHLIHGHSHVHWCLSVVFFLSFYFLLKFLFHLFLIPAMVPDDVSMNDPLCNSAIGSMVTFDYVTPDTGRRKKEQGRNEGRKECQCVLGAVVPQVCSLVLHTFLADGVVVLSLAAASTRGPPPPLME